MQKREKQLLGVMALALAAAGFMYFSAPKGTAPKAATTAASKALVEEVNKNVDQAKLTPQQVYRIGLLLEKSPGNPFFGGTGGISADEGPGPDGTGGSAEFVYSGYMKLGQKTYAVVNGVEYASGDELAEGGYRVQAIDKNFVVLERTDGSTGRRLTRRVPLVEDDTDKIRIRVVKKR
ncbi:MAG: hypothetical protein KKA55_08910 [Proteobacteria bacterium]|nr:hypothetical protein [Pseudomonadota bacterium]MBU1595636.1 hypothetical protein [Pseudomonadota bacterium]